MKTRDDDGDSTNFIQSLFPVSPSEIAADSGSWIFQENSPTRRMANSSSSVENSQTSEDNSNDFKDFTSVNATKRTINSSSSVENDDASNTSSYKLEGWNDESSGNSITPYSASACIRTPYNPCQGDQGDDSQTSKVRSNNVSAFVTFLKALFGVSLLSSPNVMDETGLVLGTLVYILLVVACVGSCYLLLSARKKVAKGPHKVHLQTDGSGSTKEIITYGDVGRKLLGRRQSWMINFLIVSLHICFGAGLVAVSSRQIAIVLGWEEYQQEDDYEYQQADDQARDDDYYKYDDDSMPVWLGRIIISSLLFPIISILLQFRNVKDLFWICSGGLVFYIVGCVGSMLYTTLVLNGDGFWDIPEDAMEWKWKGIPNFVASTLYAMEGINLALPIANELGISQSAHGAAVAAKTSSPVTIVTAVVTCFGFMTLSVAYLGYLSGLGGGAGTKNEEDYEDEDGEEESSECLAVSYCLGSETVSTIHQLSLACALILTLPIILYPSLELLEMWADERERKKRTDSFNRTLDESLIPSGLPSTPSAIDASESRDTPTETEDRASAFGVHRHWRWRVGHAFMVCLGAIVDRQWKRAFVLYKGFGLSLACFLLPCLLFVKAFSFSMVVKSPLLVTAIVGLTGLGLVNMVLVGLSVFTEHNFIPVVEDEGRHNGPGESGSHD